ncbi:glutathione S-transferase family protein [Phenylobacterium montanum]|uniref:Glutathione S-transferase family protein n=1 Tax=Phenylobacterium montanum TaxID=2823693 RepID=A0A975ITQ3_9CAUL|nr:glutathione S-transferase family protein [Caulobacter sp. S6]QUD86714.1 glutathione S-transferase family protein [Caulobacter sp. S6]
MDKPFVIYGARGSGSIPIEAALTLLRQPYQIVERAPLAEVAADEAIFKVNPLGQVPAMLLPDGELMTESAAILIWIADRFPAMRLAPDVLDRRRPAFLRWMTFVSSAIYALFWIRDDPSRLTPDPEQQALIKARTADRIAECWAKMDAQVSPGRYILSDQLEVLDLYVTVLSRWGPRRKRFYEVAPKMSEVVRRVDKDPRLKALWVERFPFVEGWEG